MFTWISYNSQIYRITGVSMSSKYEGHFMNVARSFRPLTPEQRASVSELHLKIVKARGGESLPDLSRRSSNAWNVQQTAVMNNIYTTAGLKSGQLVKVAVARSYPSGEPIR
jgi:predicted Zn-dependent protease